MQVRGVLAVAVAAASIHSAMAAAEPAWGLRFLDRDFVELADTDKLVDLNGSYTVELWAKLGEEPADARNYLVSDVSSDKYGEKTPHFCGWALRFMPGRQLNLVHAATEDRWVGYDAPPLSLKLADRFHHYAVSKTEDRVKVFVDGKAHGSKPVKNRFVLNPGNLFLGVRRHEHPDAKADFTLRGFRVSDAALYEKDFKPEEVLSKQKGTVLLLDVASGPGEDKDAVKDVSGKEHHGSIEGAKWVKLDAKDQPKK